MKRGVLIGALIALVAGGAFAELPAVFGEPLHTVDLEWGFVPDPYEHEMTAGGSTYFDAAEDLSGDYFRRDEEIEVAGYVWGEGPDVRLFYDAGQGDSLSFAFVTEGTGDAFLLVNDPDGDWWVIDDSADSLDPAFNILNPPSGQYDIWVGTWGDDFISGTLQISEIQ